jgi:Holliday junction resolvase RusA-like endonuclease
MTFFVAGTPKATPRVKACRFGNASRVYTPKTADDWKYCVQQAALKEIERKGDFRDVSVKLTMTFFLARPKSHFGKKGMKSTAPEFVTSKPDIDNLIKAIMDALTNARMWHDDAQVSSIECEKRYMSDLDTQGCRISIISLE